MNLSRRQAIALIAVSGWSAGSLCPAAAQSPGSDELRVIAYNIYKGTGYPKTHPEAKQAAASGTLFDRIADELAAHSPDIVTFSESPKEDLVRRMADRLGYTHLMFPGFGRWPGSMVTRLKIVESQIAPSIPPGSDSDLFTRHWGRVVLSLPSGKEVVIHGTHLHPRDTAIRQHEIRTTLDSIKPDADAGRSVIVMGDLNHEPDSIEYAMWKDAGLIDTFVAAGEGDGYTFTSDKLARRIDYVLACGPLANRVKEARPLTAEPFTLPPTSSHYALSDHLPQLAVFSLK